MDRLKKMLIRHEGLRLKPYTDTTGHISIGVGRNLTDRGISDSEAMSMLERDIVEHRTQLFDSLPWVYDLDDVRQAVLTDMAFNLGIAGLLKFKRTLASIRTGEYERAAVEMLESLWARQVGIRATNLADMMRSGEWPDYA